jgi:hypothetical protein
LQLRIEARADDVEHRAALSARLRAPVASTIGDGQQPLDAQSARGVGG